MPPTSRALASTCPAGSPTAWATALAASRSARPISMPVKSGAILPSHSSATDGSSGAGVWLNNPARRSISVSRAVAASRSRYVSATISYCNAPPLLGRMRRRLNIILATASRRIGAEGDLAARRGPRTRQPRLGRRPGPAESPARGEDRSPDLHRALARSDTGGASDEFARIHPRRRTARAGAAQEHGLGARRDLPDGRRALLP